jgi:hypothetical protein
MGILTIILALLVPALAPLAGYFLGKATKEELKAGKKYFIALQHVLFIAIAAVFLYAGKWSIYVVAAGLAVAFAYIAFRQARNPFFSEALFGIAFSLAVNSEIIFLLSALVFLYGLPTGSLFAMQRKGLWKSIGAGILFAIFAWGAGFLL